MAQLSHVFCTECGIQNQLSSNFCFRCGNELQKEVIKDDEETNNSTAPKERKTPNETPFVQQQTNAVAYNAAAPGQAIADKDDKKAEIDDAHLRFDAPTFIPKKPKKSKPKKKKVKKKGESKDKKAVKAAQWNKWLVESLSSGETPKPKDNTQDKESKASKEDKADKDKDKEGSKTGFCRFYGSAKGCSTDNCIYSHSNPNSVPLCKYFNIEWGLGCPWDDKCRFRHKIYDVIDEEYSGEKEVVLISDLKDQLAHLHAKSTDIGDSTDHTSSNESDQEVKQDAKPVIKQDIKPVIKEDIKPVIKEDIKQDIKQEQGETKGRETVEEVKEVKEDKEDVETVSKVEEEPSTSGGFGGWNAW